MQHIAFTMMLSCHTGQQQKLLHLSCASLNSAVAKFADYTRRILKLKDFCSRAVCAQLCFLAQIRIEIQLCGELFPNDRLWQ
jgi:hypothetical protein